ncbi:MAG: hypothetical protein AAGA30_19105, partial [Planctomycetota bacterium]
MNFEREWKTMTSLCRRKFIQYSTAASLSVPHLITTRKTANEELIIGEEPFRYRVKHHWPQLPDKYRWQVTHNVAIDSENRLYVIHEGYAKQKEHPSIFVFDEKGKFIRAFGQQFQGG